MNITDRLYTYPVLSMDHDDYATSSFEVVSAHAMSGVNTLKLKFDIKMNCEAIQRMIDDGEAEYLIHIECSTTAYRTAIKSKTNHIEIDIPISRINGIIEMVAFAVTVKDIKGYASDDWIDDYDGMRFDLKKGSVLAYQNLSDLSIRKDYEEFSDTASIFMIYKRITNEEKPIEVDMESNKIKVGLCTDDYNLYIRFRSRPELLTVLNSIIILPALVYVFEELKLEGGIEQYRNRRWYEALEKSYEIRGIDLANEILDEDKKSIILAQEAMEFPVSHALSQIASIYEDEGDEDW